MFEKSVALRFCIKYLHTWFFSKRNRYNSFSPFKGSFPSFSILLRKEYVNSIFFSTREMFHCFFFFSFCIHEVWALTIVRLHHQWQVAPTNSSLRTAWCFGGWGDPWTFFLFLANTIGSVFSFLISFFTLSPICLYQVS